MCPPELSLERSFDFEVKVSKMCRATDMETFM